MQTNSFEHATALHRHIVEQAPDAVILVDTDGIVALWNDRATTIFGYPAEETVGEGLDAIIPESLRAAHWQGFSTAIRTGTTKYAGKAMTTRSSHKDGRKLYVDLSFSLLKDSDGMVLGALAFARDVTESYLANRTVQARVRELEAELQAVRTGKTTVS